MEPGEVVERRGSIAARRLGFQIRSPGKVQHLAGITEKRRKEMPFEQAREISRAQGQSVDAYWLVVFFTGEENRVLVQPEGAERVQIGGLNPPQIPCGKIGDPQST